jgi:hypothetical protein
MKVKAVISEGKFGFYGGKRRYRGDVFEISDSKHFSKKWMEQVEPKEPKTSNEQTARGGR